MVFISESFPSVFAALFLASSPTFQEARAGQFSYENRKIDQYMEMNVEAKPLR